MFPVYKGQMEENLLEHFVKGKQGYELVMKNKNLRALPDISALGLINISLEGNQIAELTFLSKATTLRKLDITRMSFVMKLSHKCRKQSRNSKRTKKVGEFKWYLQKPRFFLLIHLVLKAADNQIKKVKGEYESYVP